VGIDSSSARSATSSFGGDVGDAAGFFDPFTGEGIFRALRGAEILLIDDLQHICGRTATISEFLHTVNAFTDLKRKVVIAADRPPATLEGLQRRGHRIVTIDDYNQFGCGQMIWKLDGGYFAASDPRRDGQAVGF